jgi:hypothetical protein
MLLLYALCCLDVYVLEGKLLHFRCATHVFNLIVQDGLKVIKNVVNNIRESVQVAS